MRLGVFVFLSIYLAVAEYAWAGGYTLPAKVLRFQSGMLSDLVEVQIGDRREVEATVPKVIFLELRYDYLRLLYWYGFRSPFSKTDFDRCVGLLAQHAAKQDVFDLGFMGFGPASNGTLHVRAFDLDKPKDGQQESICYIVDHKI